MPNGGLSEPDFAEQERFFSPVASTLEEFASSHNLLVERYYHDAPVWSLRFAHPAGGSATIDVARAAEDSLTISGTWWLDVYTEFTRYLRDTKRVACSKQPAAVTSVLRAAFSEMLDWHPGAWSRVSRDYQAVWGKFSEREFYRMGPHYPQPRRIE